jgi:hypothetical protein
VRMCAGHLLNKIIFTQSTLVHDELKGTSVGITGYECLRINMLGTSDNHYVRKLMHSFYFSG